MHKRIYRLVGHRSFKQIKVASRRAARNGSARAARLNAIKAEIRFGLTGSNIEWS